MKIFNLGNIRNLAGVTLAASSLTFLAPAVAAKSGIELQNRDTVELSLKVTPSGTASESVLKYAPSPRVNLKDEYKTATFVVDLLKNILYQYDEGGKAVCAYLVASGKPSTPTESGLRVVTHVESYPYKTAPVSTKRRNQPWNYGSRIICVDKIDAVTGVRSKTGEFIHGNNNPKSLGKYSSMGCIRMDNEVIKKLAKVVKKGDLILLRR